MYVCRFISANVSLLIDAEIKIFCTHSLFSEEFYTLLIEESKLLTLDKFIVVVFNVKFSVDFLQSNSIHKKGNNLIVPAANQDTTILYATH